MAEPSDAEVTGPVSPGIETAVYIDASALAKLYVPEAESERLDTFLCGRLGLMISELAITEVLSAVARRKREGELRPELANQIRGALLADADSGSFARLHLDPAVHREAERPLLATDSLPLRTLDALHIALAFSGRATHVLTFDRRMREAAVQAGVNVIDISAQDAIVLHRSAVVLGVLGDLPAAIAREEKALALDPLSEEICRRLGFFFVANRQFAQARPLYEKALAIAPNSDRARFNLGDLDLLDNQPEQALASFRQTGIEELRLAGQAQAEYTLRHTTCHSESLSS